ncbi:cupin domain-containing protein [Streptomyces decoyicus]|uniref:cupin domain-containing protein n=1 Tax=Streptomyces decoyicus TaxID=249567 RepID=UPI003641176E
MTAEPSAVVARLGGDSFLAEVFGRTYRLVRGDASTVAGLLTWDDLNWILGRNRMEAPRLRLSKDGETVPQDAYTHPFVTRRSTVWHRLHPSALHEQLGQGATLVIDAVDELHPGVQRLASDLEAWLRTQVQVNLYASWTGREGFGTHWDDHDVVVVQLDGAKRWKIFGPTRVAPMHRDVEAPEEPPEKPTADVVLKAGDMLYLPRGWWHNVAASEGERSLHLTCGLTTMTGADLIIWLSETLRREGVVRSDLPRFASPAEKQTFVDSLRKLLIQELDSGTLIDRYARHHDAMERVRFRPSLPFVAEAPADPNQRVQMLTTRHALALDNDSNVVLTAGGESWTFAKAARTLLERLSDGQPHILAELIDGTEVTVEQAAKLVGELVKGQVATIGGEL